MLFQLYHIRFFLNTNFETRLFDTFWQFYSAWNQIASIWAKLFNIFSFSFTRANMLLLFSRLFCHLIRATWKRYVKLFSVFWLIFVLEYQVISSGDLRCFKNKWIERNSTFHCFCFCLMWLTKQIHLLGWTCFKPQTFCRSLLIWLSKTSKFNFILKPDHGFLLSYCYY